MFHTVTMDLIGFITLVISCISIGICIPVIATGIATGIQIAKYRKLERESRAIVSAMQKEGE